MSGFFWKNSEFSITFKFEWLFKIESSVKWTFASDVHPSNELAPIEITDDGIVTFIRLVQFLKQFLWIIEIELGRFISINEEQFSKALVPMDVTDSGMVICDNDEQL